VGRESESDVRDSLVRAPKDVPHAVRRAIYCDIRTPVAVKIRGKRDVFANAKPDRLGRGIGRTINVPFAGRWAIDRDIGAAVAVKIGGHRPVFGDPETQCPDRAVRTVLDPPFTRRRAIDGNIGPPVSIEICVGGKVTGGAELMFQDLAGRAVNNAKICTGAVAQIGHAQVRPPVTVKIEWGLASRFSARAGIAVGDDDVVEVLPLAKRSDVGADAPAKPYRAAGSRRRECGDGIDKFGCRVNAAAAAPTGPPAKRVAAASVDQAIVPSI